MVRTSADCQSSLAKCIDNWILNSTEPSWDKFIECVRKVDHSVAMRFEKSICYNYTIQRCIFYSFSGESVTRCLNNAVITEIFSYYENILYKTIDEEIVGDIVVRLIEEQVLPHSILCEVEKCSTAENGKKKLLAEVKKAVEAKFMQLEVFAAVLTQFSKLQPIGKSMLSEYCKIFLSATTNKFVNLYLLHALVHFMYLRNDVQKLPLCTIYILNIMANIAILIFCILIRA